MSVSVLCVKNRNDGVFEQYRSTGIANSLEFDAISVIHFYFHSDMGQAPVEVPIPTPAPVATTTQTTTKTANNYTHTRIQIRNQDGSTLTETFEVKESLAAIRLFVQLKQGADTSFNLMTTFPRRVFTEDDYDKPLYLLGLVPSAVLIVTKA